MSLPVSIHIPDELNDDSCLDVLRQLLESVPLGEISDVFTTIIDTAESDGRSFWVHQVSHNEMHVDVDYFAALNLGLLRSNLPMVRESLFPNMMDTFLTTLQATQPDKLEKTCKMRLFELMRLMTNDYSASESRKLFRKMTMALTTEKMPSGSAIERAVIPYVSHLIEHSSTLANMSETMAYEALNRAISHDAYPVATVVIEKYSLDPYSPLVECIDHKSQALVGRLENQNLNPTLPQADAGDDADPTQTFRI